MKPVVAGALAALISVAALSGAAEAKGCVKGAIIGGIAGHYAGHHGLLGAAGGCIVGHHMASRHERAIERNGSYGSSRHW